MNRCNYCGWMIFGGRIRGDGFIYCDDDCFQNGIMLSLEKEISDESVDEKSDEIHNGLCPKCHGKGPIDVYTSHRILSIIVFSTWKSIDQVSCRICGIKSQMFNMLFCISFGWWGMPFGIIMTPVQICRIYLN